MRTPPTELSDAAVIAALAAGWGLRGAEVEYLPVGFGSHHWRARAHHGPRFVTADDLDERRRAADEPRDATFERLRAALRTARALRDAGLVFVVAPIPTTHGEVVRRVSDRFALALYPQVEGQARSWGDDATPAERLAILDLVVAIHGAPTKARASARREDFRLANRDALERALAEVDRTWDGGPYAEPARGLIADHSAGLEALLGRYDRLAAEAAGAARRPDRFVLTHGEPHLGNTIQTEDGWLMVDWDTALLAPPERDLWILAENDAEILHSYTAATGRPVDRGTLELYRLAFDLADIAIFVAQFRQPHLVTEDTEKAWQSLAFRLARTDPGRR